MAALTAWRINGRFLAGSEGGIGYHANSIAHIALYISNTKYLVVELNVSHNRSGSLAWQPTTWVTAIVQSTRAAEAIVPPVLRLSVERTRKDKHEVECASVKRYQVGSS